MDVLTRQSTNPYTSMYGGRYGVGINRRTWRAGQTVGRVLKRWWRGANDQRPRQQAARTAQKASYRKGSARGTIGKLDSGVTAFGISGPGSQSKYAWPAQPKVMALEKMPRNIYVQPFIGTSVTSAIGQQVYTQAASMFTPTDLTAMFNLVHASVLTRLYFESAYQEVMIANPLNTSLRIKIYDVECKRDIGAVAGGGGNMGTPLLTLLNTLGDLSGGAAADFKVIGTTPFDNPVFMEYYKIAKVTNLLLGGGQEHVHVVTAHPNKVLDSTIPEYSPYGIQGLTKYVMLQIFGMPANDSTTKTQVSTTATRTSYISNTTYRYAQPEETALTWNAGTQLPTSFTVGANVEEDYVLGAEVAPTL